MQIEKQFVLQSAIRNPHSEIDLAEATGVEPARDAFARLLSRQFRLPVSARLQVVKDLTESRRLELL